MSIELSIVVPVHNESGNIEQVVARIEQAFVCSPTRTEILVVDDGSEDDSPQILSRLVEEERIRLITHRENKGYGAALRSGFGSARGEFVSFIDGDGQLDAMDLQKLFAVANSKLFVVGYRARRNDSIHRVLLGKLFSRIFVPLTIGVRLRDIDCALKVFPRNFLSKVVLTADGALINAEILSHAKQLGYGFLEFPVQHYQRLRGEQSGAKFSVIARVFAELWKVRCATRAAEMHREVSGLLKPVPASQ